MNRRQVKALVVMLCLLAPLFPETKPDTDAVPYGPAEFPQWQKDIRRAEILSFGALPFVTFFSAIYYDVYRYYSHDMEDGYLPWPLKNSATAVALTEDEQKRILAYSAGISVGVALFDFGYRTIRREINSRKAERDILENGNAIEIEPIVENGGGAAD